MPALSPERHPTRWVGISPEERRAERRTLLLDAAYDLLGTAGSPGTTVRAVCHAARLNPRYFYESFDDLDALIVAVYDRLVAALGEEVRAALAAAGDDPGGQTRAAIGRIVEFVDEDRRRARVLFVEALGNESLNRRRIETGHALVAAVEQFAIDRHGPPPAGERIGRMASAVIVGGTSELIMSWLTGAIDVGRDQLVDDATRLFLAVGEAAAALAAARAGRGEG
ncbi:MAG TPA: TetR/AcrR family transcriptional regulator [Acidimicrobiales bacterium]|nr:TetR/AcrR family transcriptional regulator [Acidimicrobiales bacterium]